MKVGMPGYMPKRANAEERARRQQEHKLKVYASLINDQAQLDEMIAGVRPEMRQACYYRILPFLKFDAQFHDPDQVPAETV